MDEKFALNRIGLLTSGGDAPGMNAAIRAVVRTAIAKNIQVLGIRRGYSGLINGDVMEMTARTVNNLTSRGGTMLYTARCPEFVTEEGQKRAASACKYLGLQGLIAIGGDGTFRGLRDLSKFGVHTCGIPATIDNDISSTDYTIGFDTACNTAIEAIDKLSDTMQSHERISVVEVMGHKAGHLAMNVGIGSGATSILIPEHDFDFEQDIIERIREGRINGKHHFIIIVAEGVGNTSEIAGRIAEDTGIDTRVTIIGHIQRGGSPNSRDRVMATRMGFYAVNALLEGKTNIVVCYKNAKMIDMNIDEALKMKKPLDESMYDMLKYLCV